MSDKLSDSFMERHLPFSYPFDWKPIAEKGSEREKRLLSTIEVQRRKLVNLRKTAQNSA